MDSIGSGFFMKLQSNGSYKFSLILERCFSNLRFKQGFEGLLPKWSTDMAGKVDAGWRLQASMLLFPQCCLSALIVQKVLPPERIIQVTKTKPFIFSPAKPIS
jgi:hypothetical protein